MFTMDNSLVTKLTPGVVFSFLFPSWTDWQLLVRIMNSYMMFITFELLQCYFLFVVQVLLNKSIKPKMDDIIGSLDQSLLDVLMKYIYRGFEQPSEGSSATLLLWHEKVFSAAGVGCIVRVLTDRKRVWTRYTEGPHRQEEGLNFTLRAGSLSVRVLTDRKRI